MFGFVSRFEVLERNRFGVLGESWHMGFLGDRLKVVREQVWSCGGGRLGVVGEQVWSCGGAGLELWGGGGLEL